MVYVLFQCGQSWSKAEPQRFLHTATPSREKQKDILLVTALNTTAGLQQIHWNCFISMLAIVTKENNHSRLVGLHRGCERRELLPCPTMNYYCYLTLLQSFYITSSLSSQTSWINSAFLKIISKIIYSHSKQ